MTIGVEITNEAGLTLQLIPGQNLVTEQNAAWLSDDVLPGEFSYPINAPLNENNKRFVEHAYRPDAAFLKQAIPVRVQMESVLYRQCVFVFQVQAGKLNGHLKIDSSEFYDRIGKMTLLDALPDLINLGNGVRTENGVIKATSLGQRMAEIAALKPGEFPCTFFPVRNQGFWDENFDGGGLTGFVKNEYVNAYEQVPSVGLTFLADTSTVKGSVIVPFFYLSWVLIRIMDRAGYRIESDWLAKPDVQRLVVFNMTAMSQTTAIYGGSNQALNGHLVKAGMHLPDMSVTDFLLALKGQFGLLISFTSNDKVCRITSFLDTVKAGPAIDLTPYQSGLYGSTNASGKGYSVSEFIDSQDGLYKSAEGELIQPEPQLIGKGEQPTTLRIGTTQLIYTQNKLPGAGYWFVPTVSQPGNLLDPTYKISERYLDDKGKRKNSTGLKLLNFVGMTQDSRFVSYPLATPDVRDGRQNVVGSTGLMLAGRYGRWRNDLRAYYHFRDNTQVIKQPLLMPTSVLASLLMNRSVLLTLDDYVSRAYLIQKIQAEAPGVDGKVMVQLEALTIPTGLELPADADGTVVWVEWIPSAETLTGDRLRLANFKATRTYTAKFWADRNKTTPAVVTNLLLSTRQKRTLFYSRISHDPKFTRSVYDESTRTYTVNGQSTIVETSYVVDELKGLANLQELQTIPDGVTQSLTLDPGDGYNII